MERKTFVRRAFAGAASLLAIAAAAPLAAAEDKINFNIDAQPLAEALTAFSDQAGVVLVAPSRLTAGKSAPRIEGALSSDEALSRLLTNANLDARRDDSGAIVILAQAETTVTSAAPEAPLPVDEIVVSGFRSSFKSSLETKRDASQILDAITAEEIGQFPDQNIAEAIQRVTGVQITRNNGEGETVNIRGLSANFTRVEVDGRSTSVTIDSSSPERQSVLSVFASDLYNSIEVIKSPTAADVEGGVGGIVRLNTPNPLTVGKLAFGGDVGYTEADTRDDGEPSVNAFYSNVFMDERLGVLLAGTYEDKDRRIDKIQSNQNWEVIDLGDGTAGFVPGRLRQEQRLGESPKYNINAKLQYEASDTLELFLNGYVTSEERDETRNRVQVTFDRGDLITGTLGAITGELGGVPVGTLIEGVFEDERVEFISFDRQADVTTEGLTGGFIWEPENWRIQAEASYASSEEDYVETRASFRENRDDAEYSIVNDPEYPEFTAAPVDFDLSDLDTRQLDVDFRTITIEETDFELDFERFVDLGVISGFEFGARYASAEFDRKQGFVASPEEGNLTFGDATALVIDDFGSGFGGSGLLTSWPAVDAVELYNLAPSTEDPFSSANADESLWSITEETIAAYALANFEAPDLFGIYARGNAGVRVVQTSYEGDGVIDLAIDGGTDFGNIGSQTLDRDYTDVLPSFNFILSKEEDSNLLVRGAVSRALSRPEVEDLQPGLVIRIVEDALENDGDPNTEEGTFEEGNPDLDPFRAWQYDIGVEWYFGEGGESALTAAFFYKDVENFVTRLDEVRTYQNVDLGIGTTGTLNIISENYPINGGEATVQGFEVGFQTPFYFLPGFWSDFGLFANYTYTDSEASQVSIDSDTGERTVTETPFPGASENSFNIVGYYERGGFSSRIAYNYRDEYLIIPFQSDFDGDDVRESNAEYGDKQGRLDLALRYRFENGVRLSFDALNLTEEQNYKYYDTTDRLEDLEVEGRIYTFRLGYIF